MTDQPRDYRRLLVLLSYLGHDKKVLKLSSIRLAHLLSVTEFRILELLSMLADEDYIELNTLSEEIILKKETTEEIKESASPYEQRCRIKYADIGIKWGFEQEDYAIYDIAMVYKRERERRTTVMYPPFSMKKDPRKQPPWAIYRRAFLQLKEYGWDVHQYMIAQIEETSWCKNFVVLPISWLGTDKSRERMCKWLEKNKLTSLHTKKDSAYEQSKHLVESIMRSRKDCRTPLDVLAIPGILDQLSAEFLQECLKTVQIVK